MPKILVTAKVNPDIDGTACILAYADWLTRTGRPAEGVIFGSLQSEAKYFVERQKINIPTRPDDGKGGWEKFILVDMSSLKGSPKVVKAERVIEAIDHRSFTEPAKEFPLAKIQNELVGAAATLIVEKFIRTDLRPKEDHARLLYGAIFENSLNFLATNATDRDREAVKYLEEKFNISKDLVPEMFKFSTQKILASLESVLALDAKDFDDFAREVSLRALQLTVFGIDLPVYQKQLEETTRSLEVGKNFLFSFLNLIDLEKGQSYLFASNRTGEEMLAKALGVAFSGG